MQLRKSLIVFLTLLFLLTNLKAQYSDPPFLKFINHPWVDSVLKSLSLEQQIAQCIWVPCWSDRDISHLVEVSDIIRKSGVGGIIFFQGTPGRQAEFTNYFQKISKVPLLISTGAEWGLGMRIPDVEKFPFQMTLGAVQNDSLLYMMGKAVALQSRRLGITMVLDTAADIKNNPLNPVINNMTFGENREKVASKTYMYTKGMQDNGLIATLKYFKTGVADAKAFEAGNDIIVYVTNVDSAIIEIKNFLIAKKITRDDIASRCRKILAAKFWVGLRDYTPVSEADITNHLTPGNSQALIRELYASALTVLNNNQNIIPVRHLETTRIATLAIGKSVISVYQKTISKYVPVDHYMIDSLTGKKSADILKMLARYDLIIAGIFNTDQRPGMNYGIPEGLEEFLEKLNAQNRCIITYFGNPYAVGMIKSIQKADGLIVGYQENSSTENLSAQLIFGGIGAKGFLPVSINEKYPEGYGLITPGDIRLQYGIPESSGIASEFLTCRIDSIANSGIKAGAYPGCEIMIARKGMVIFNKTYGYQTYDNRISVSEDDLYDLASVTKISGTVAGLMLLNSSGKFSPDEKLGTYLPEFRRSNKGDLLMKDILTHQAGLISWIPFWKETVKKNGKFRRNIFSHEQSEKYPLEVAIGLYINKNYRKKIFNEIKKSSLNEKKLVYSDLGFMIIPDIIDRLSGQKWYDFVTNNIYHKIGAYDLGFNPYLKYPLSRIVPTEYDSLFRKQLLQGTVHDEGAAMLGGISGHAGLFATANDLLKLMELYRRMGNFGGEQLISADVMKLYTSVQFPENKNRKGLGFDKPMIDTSGVSQEDIYPTKDASPESFGHSGFTGTFVWIDPKYEISYIFLCNSVYPTRNNKLLVDLNLRTRILQVIYDSIKEDEGK